MIRFVTITLIIITAGLLCKAQQVEQFTQHTFSHFLFNPAAAGHGGHGKLVFKHRSQWVGAFNGEEPVTQILTFDTRFKNKYKNLGIGAILFNDQTGPSSRRGLELAYSYKLKLGSSGAKLSLGMSGMFLQYNIDFNALQTEIPDDPALLNPEQNKIGADGSAGIYLYDKNYYFGLSADQLFENKFAFVQEDTGFVKLAQHFYVIAGYVYDLSEKVEFEPSILVKSIEAIPVQFDLNVRLILDKQYWLGVNYRASESVSAYAGITYNKKWHLGYSYDYPISNLAASHEVLLGFDIKKKKAKTPTKEGTIIVPTGK